ncbi:FtsW/RodA/SpoVE family cell cycle protein [Odoribacter lunatus]|uniref:FtsW/RodA/SpoVE family cell cycle protein n=1 Tax=Odoribacter lunatus TaxID=2941335 RepID=UPI002041C0D9|nr:FtsW/RodA/SpoVE family cell cycle protein [Odoribacter lunatus]
MFNWQNKISFKGDKVLWYVIIGLMIASVMVVYSSTGRLAYSVKHGNTSFYLIKQLILMVVCFVLILGLQSVHYRYLFRFSKIILGMSFIFLLWAKFAGTNLNDADRWITIPGIGFTFQPSELAKIGVILYVARIITYYQTERGCSDEALKSVLLYVGPVIFLIFLDNFSTSFLLGLICMTMLFVGRLRLRLMFMSIGALLGTVGLILLLAFTVPQFEKIGRVATIKARIMAFFKGGQKEGYDYQAEQAKIAVAKGGFLGVGPGNSEQRNFLPHPYSDFIFAIIIEEYGLVGGGAIMLFYLIVLFRVGVIVRKCTRTFPALLVTGLGLSIVFQAFVNMGVCVGVFPVTGQPLPLVSMGGTSLLFTSAALGMILSVSHTFMDEEKVLNENTEEGEEENKEEIVGVESEIPGYE